MPPKRKRAAAKKPKAKEAVPDEPAAAPQTLRTITTAELALHEKLLAISLEKRRKGAQMGSLAIEADFISAGCACTATRQDTHCVPLVLRASWHMVKVL